ncbi:AcrR family transcriptional regulator [Actinoalloteichus hoggarensis]|uniref:HTH-type transcriptional repressor AcnR n=1 Tax=Actinoalloteichus hoggarensis TaxID=1470176 RepID=A0A221W166_9PSEU|nr:TetR family transcriptional regulator [Actinoalloteichus hoggarensis]ASO19527.1 HTH-type transcriptional repressor AcnR [Actinoalloteichus hoggarensis]MBB5919766.1 AcrR family transcriptional regulator [Actinoalloteichus hoggarensis]
MNGPTNSLDESGGPRRRGPRSGGDTRAALLRAAKEVFAERGYERATVRVIAERAGVDPAMVNHSFGGKEKLFAAAVELPFDPALVVETILAGEAESAPERLIATFVSVWDAHADGFAALVRSFSSTAAAAEMLRTALSRFVIGEALGRLGIDQPGVRGGLVASQIIGLGITRYTLRLEPMSTADPAWLVAVLAPTLRRYLFDELAPPSARD